MQELFHTSPTKIEKIHTDGRFGEFLFFAGAPYFMGGKIIYKTEIDMDSVIEASRMFYQEESDCEEVEEIIKEVATRFDVAAEDAIDLISGKIIGFNEIEGFDGDDAWYIQHCAARVAKAMGFKGVELHDEQGTSYMIDMLNHEMTYHSEI